MTTSYDEYSKKVVNPFPEIIDINEIAKNNGWNVGGTSYYKDGYEVYFGMAVDGFNLTYKDFETEERKVAVEVRCPNHSPAWFASLIRILENAESYVHEQQVSEP